MNCFNTVRFAQKRSKQQLGELRLDADLCGPPHPRLQYFAHPGRLEYLRRRRSLHRRHFVTEFEASGQDPEQFAVGLVDL